MTGAELQRLLDADPFEPFIVPLTGGWTHTVDRPEFVAVTPTGGCAKLTRPDGHWAVISLDHVTSITYPDVPAIR